MNTCKTCKHWGKDPDREWASEESDTHKVCASEKFHYGYYGFASLKADEVMVEDDVGWGFVAGPDFGCVHHEQA